MFNTKSTTKLKFLFILLSLQGITCTIDGTFSKHRPNGTKPGEDPCNPLYWYPKNIPEYCNFKNMPTPPTDPFPEFPIPIPIPVPLPAPLPMLPPPVVPPLPPPPPVPVPHPIMPLPIPLPFGIPLAPSNPMVPVAGIPYPPPPPAFPMPFPSQYPVPYPPPYRSPYLPPVAAPYPPPFMSPYPGQYPGLYPAPYPPPYPIPPRSGMGMVPGLPGLVSPDGGINIMPFSDAYSDILEKHKQKMIRRRIHKFLSDYERPPWKSRRKTRRQNVNEVSNEEKLFDNITE